VLFRSISHYLVRLYEGSTLVFHGIIDTSFVSHDAKTDVVSFTCYDYLRLFAKFDDQTMLYALHSGYSADYCFRYLAQGIEIALSNEITNPCTCTATRCSRTLRGAANPQATACHVRKFPSGRLV
jgi:hypothetical protein